MLVCRPGRRFAILLDVSNALLEIGSCPASFVREALDMVLRELTPDQRHGMVAQFGKARADISARDTLKVALRDNRLRGAAWGQLQPGKTAIYWVPQLTQQTAESVASDLTHAVASALDAADVEMTQTLLPDRSAPIAAALESSGFNYLAELLYLAGEASSVSDAPQNRNGLKFLPYDDSQHVRLTALIERTYEGTLDCAAMNGKRRMDDVLDGYRATGVFRPDNWLIVERAGRDVGVLLMAEEPAAGHSELVYMGLVPEARGNGWGVDIARHALRIAGNANADRVVLAVDAANSPAMEMYGRAGFTTWDRRAVFVRFRGSQSL